jgi:hypothetical protein
MAARNHRVDDQAEIDLGLTQLPIKLVKEGELIMPDGYREGYEKGRSAAEENKDRDVRPPS